jgi:hypothetical protein
MPLGADMNLVLITVEQHGKEEEMGRAYSILGETEKCVLRFGQKPEGKI